MRIETVPYDHPDAQRLIEEVQQEYVVRYGEQDTTPVDIDEFTAPRGLFLIGYRHEQPMVSGGWRAHESDEPGFRDGDAELKRMYVVPRARGLGLARAMLAELERTAARAGRRRVLLETGLRQPEAIGLYRSSGYHEIEKFGVYRCEPDSRCFAKNL
ncbi:acetyltransferase (GNAT) family protein [Halopolyspora algeriensis]|uniref:Acetyltransferase (GNAT) family protein n=1 Tax=Halopolyspora algeriensis TaxID=1500506 RepID=A0A368VTC1_9ACTN|nr:GNAT family N-acetyltransferase [Halopolyspora algeriensis]RCW45240.1 acetyltransferase (GNAT) family protein [Halopolyspora algeriensis]TQM53041.1 acetyltransferase (GNAT) family protein [Halopolyspora algeriensis]